MERYPASRIKCISTETGLLKKRGKTFYDKMSIDYLAEQQIKKKKKWMNVNEKRMTYSVDTTFRADQFHQTCLQKEIVDMNFFLYF